MRIDKLACLSVESITVTGIEQERLSIHEYGPGKRPAKVFPLVAPKKTVRVLVQGDGEI
jgi:hypothetical protein